MLKSMPFEWGASLALALCVAPAAWAGLGERVESVQRDQVALSGASVKVTPMARAQVHEIATFEGATVREYISADGVVFATTWSGPVMPDLKVVLAGHHAEYMAGAQALRRSGAATTTFWRWRHQDWCCVW